VALIVKESVGRAGQISTAIAAQNHGNHWPPHLASDAAQDTEPVVKEPLRYWFM